MSLVDREADLLHRGCSPDSMSGLRQRSANRFLALIKMPKFNPAAYALQIEPQSSSRVPAWPPAMGAASGTAELVVHAATVAAGEPVSAAESSRTV